MISKHKVTVIAVISAIVIILMVWPESTSTKKPEVQAAKPLSIQTWQTANDAKVLYVYAPELPMVDVQLVFDAGSARDAGQYGLANFTNSMLSHGASLNDTILSVDDITERLDNVGARYGANVSRDMAEVSLRSLTDETLLQPAVETLRAIITKPLFDEKEFQRVKKQLLLGFDADEQSPGTIADELFYAVMFEGTSYARPVAGMRETVSKLTRDELVTFYNKYYVGGNAIVTIVGDVSRDKAEELAEYLVGALPKGEKVPALNSVTQLDKAQQHHRDYPSNQTHILVGQPGMHRKDEDYFKLYLGNHILGGSGFGSRIMKEIREKRGLAYSSYSYFYPMRNPGPFIMGMQTSNKQAAEALTVLNETLSSFIENGPTEEELVHAKKNITGGFPLRIDSNSDISGYLAVIGFYDLPLDYLKKFNQRIEAITAADIKDAFKRRIVPGKMITVTVGAKE